MTREVFNRVKREQAAFFYPEEVAWSDGLMRRIKVSVPNRTSEQGPAQLSRAPMPASLRLLKVHPDDSRPAPGASCTCHEGFLVVGAYTDESHLSGARVGVCRLVDERAYPVTALIGTLGFRLRIEASGAAPSTGKAGNDLAEVANDSHRGFVPPGVRLDPGEVITTDSGDEYLVVPPVQRDILGDVVGLSWRGPTGGRIPTPDNDPTPTTPPNTLPSVPGWWNEVDP